MTSVEERKAWSKFAVPKYVKVSLPHAALVALCTVYVLTGAFVFHTVEAPNEARVKLISAQRVLRVTSNFARAVWARRYSKRDEWTRGARLALRNVTQSLYEAYATEYVDGSTIDLSESDGLCKPVQERWTMKSAVFFATTTMITVGYGNIAPSTSHGRLLCMLYALFGCPLAIITLGDFGKFLSELVVLCYNYWRRFKAHLRRALLSDGRGKAQEKVAVLSYDDMFLDDEGISPGAVLLIFLAYTTAGALIFSNVEESWSFMDAFYFCFITITTVGLGDFVPKNDPFYAIAISYTAVGIGITTMCIDLVGTKYIMKIHYFGRKLRGADMIRYLLRKKLKEKKILLAKRAAEIIDTYMSVINE